MIAVREAFQAGLFGRSHLANNIIAGVIVGIVALPLSMAFAIASGAKPEQGLYTAMVAGVLTSLFGGTRIQISGPTGAFIIILSSITAQYGYDGLQIAGLMAGVLLLIMGFSRMGTMIKYIPYPVTMGFTAGIAVVIWVGQWKYFLGLEPVAAGEHFHAKLYSLIQSFPTLHLTSALVSCSALALLLLTPRLTTRIPAPLIAMLGATFLQGIFQFEGVDTIGSAFGGIPRELPSFQLPVVTVDRILELVGPAFTIAMLGAIESLLSAVVADGMAGTHHDSNQELVGQGIANVVSPLFGGFAATGAIARTATNFRNGGTSPLSGIVHALTLLLIMLALAPYAVHIPLGALAAILFVVAYNMSNARSFFHLVRTGPRSDVAVVLSTFGLTVFADLVVAVNVGVVLASLLFMRRMADSVRIDLVNSESSGAGLAPETEVPHDVLLYSIDGPFFFGAAESFERTMASLHTDLKTLVIRLARVPFIDATAINAFQEMLTLFQKRGTRVILCEANARVKSVLVDAGVLEKLGGDNYCADVDTALRAAKNYEKTDYGQRGERPAPVK